MRARPRLLPIFVLLALLALLVVLTACGGNSSSSKTPTAAAASQATGAGQQPAATTSSSATTPTAGGSTGSAGNACTLLTVDEIQTAVGMPTSAGKASGAKECTWPVGPPEESRTVDLTLLTVELYTGLAPSTAVKVTGIGDDASWASGMLTLYVHAGKQAFAVQVVTLQDDTTVRASAKMLAAKVLERLQAR